MNDPAPTAPLVPAPSPVSTCANCSAPLQGKYCHACGQPIKGMVRPLSGLTADVVDSVFNLDSRILRTLGPLYFRPGLLTTEYFIGRRQRYVTPFRLFFFLTIVAFFSVQLYLDQSGFAKAALVINEDATIENAVTAEEVEQRRAKALQKLGPETATPGVNDADNKALGIALQVVNRRADARLAYLKAAEEAKAKGVTLPVVSKDDELQLTFNGKAWDAKSNPLNVDWLPAAGNAKLNEMAAHAKDNLLRLRTEPKRLLMALLGVLPQTLFVLMPLFALMLKVFYLFKRRYYMEHLIVALHSHAFISATLLLISLLGLLQLAAPVAAPLIGGVMTVATWWMPFYLLFMQKRVYRQGWTMTILKYTAIGISYVVLISFALLVAGAVTLVVA